MDWEELFNSNAEDLIRVCWRILGRRADVDDCVQETFLAALAVRQRETVHNWPGLLRRIAVMKALARLRKRKRTPEIANADEFVRNIESNDSPDRRILDREMHERLRREVSLLADRDAAVFCLRYFESLSVQETAAILGISPGAVAAASLRARKQLASRFDDLNLNTSSKVSES